MLRDKFEFMESTWGFTRMPINLDAIHRPSDPFSRAACAKEMESFERKFLLGAIRGRLTYGYLWSVPNPQLPPEGTGTGYGKTATLRASEIGINEDFGSSVLTRLNLKNPPMIAAAYTSLDNEDTRGLYALLFSAVERWADATQCLGPTGSIMRSARSRIVERIGRDKEAAIRTEVDRVRRALPGGGTLPPLREEVLAAFCSADDDALKNDLAEIKPLSRARNGLAFFEAAYACLAAAGIEHVILLVDQLEYMVTNRAVSKAQKSREIARFRTVFTQHPGLGDRCHVIFTLHRRASQNLQEFWDANRLPPFDPYTKENHNSVVILRGLESPERIGDLLIAYFDAARPMKHAKRGTTYPVDPSAFATLWEHSTARPGIILRRVVSALELAAEENRDVVDAKVIQRVLDSPVIERPSLVRSENASSLLG
jgi:hypothetical protein